jgi:drug/metabolite transporter (DMT)-like permease
MLGVFVVSLPPWLWVAFTLLAATAQTFRNAAQRSLIERLGTAGATHVRFIFGLPFGLLALLALSLAWGAPPRPTAASMAWTTVGAVCQIAATAMMLAAMRERSFVVTIAFIKTEPIQVAVFAMAFLGERVTPALAAAVVIATAGVLVLSWPRRIASWRSALLGIGAGGVFALSAVGFRGGVVALGAADFVPAAILTLAISLTIQTTLLSAWLAIASPGVLAAIVRAWRVSLPAGLLGAFASLMWLLAFAIESPARVRTLALVEILIAGLISRRLFAQSPGLAEVAGMALVCGGIVLLFQG